MIPRLSARVRPVIILAVFWALTPIVYTATAATPNVLVIVGDDMGYSDIGVHGCKDIPTPNIDALAAAGVRCTSGYVSGTYCSPTRAGLLTGRYQNRFGHEYNPGGSDARKARQRGEPAQNKAGLPLSEITMADRLKDAGYTTALIGKWHLGGSEPFHPMRRGFDEFFGFLGGAHSYLPGKGAPILRGYEPVNEKEYLTDAIANESVAFLDRQTQDKPFFLYLAFNAVHTPMEADDARLKKFAHISDKKRQTYAAMMSAMDDAIGKVLGKLSEKKLDENTLVVFISDNGGPTIRTTTVNGSINKPLRGSKRTTLEGGIRVPYLVRWSGKIPAGKVYDQPVIQLDILPTVLAAAGVSAAEGGPLEGVNLLPFLTGEKTGTPHDALFWRFGPQMAIRQGDWKLVKYDPTVDGEEVSRSQATEAKLYNLANDIGEKNNLIEAEPQKAKELQAAWDKWNASNVPPAWGNDGKAKKAKGRRQRAA
jgi:arylsulfatase A-like enzyme